MKRLRVLVLSVSILLGSTMCASAITEAKEGNIIKYEESKESNKTVQENVKASGPIIIEFKEKIDTKDKNCVFVYEKESEKNIEVNVSFGENEKELIITPKDDLKNEIEYIVYIMNLKYKDSNKYMFDMYSFKTEKYVEKKEEDKEVVIKEKEEDKAKKPEVEKKVEVEKKTEVKKKPASLLEQVRELAKEVNKLPAQFEGVGYDFRIDDETVIKFPGALERKFPKKEEWIRISDKMPKELYEYPYMKPIDWKFWDNKKLYNFEPSSTSYAMPGKYRIENTYIPLAKGYLENKYTYDYRKQEDNMKNVLPYTKSGCPLGYDEKEKKELFPDDVYKMYLGKFKNEKIVSIAQFITDDSLVYVSRGEYIVRGILKIKYIEGTSNEFLNKYGFKKDTWYEIDKEVAFSNISEDTKMWNRWVSKSVYTMSAEYSLSGLRESLVEVE